MKIPIVRDYFNVRPQPKHFAAARPCERKKLLSFIESYLKACEKADQTLPAFRKRVNED